MKTSAEVLSAVERIATEVVAPQGGCDLPLF